MSIQAEAERAGVLATSPIGSATFPIEASTPSVGFPTPPLLSTTSPLLSTTLPPVSTTPPLVSTTTPHAVSTTPHALSATPHVADDGPQASLLRTLALARPAAGRLALATLLGAGALAAAIGLIATSAWLISRSSQRPQESAVAIAIVGVQFFALSRGLCRYAERLVGHDAAFRVLSSIRVAVYERLERLAPLGLPAFRSGELLARLVHDVDSLQDLLLRVVPPFAIALLVGAGTVALVWWMLPGAGLILLIALLIAAVLVPWLTGVLAARSEGREAATRGLLTASVVDLFEGAPELVVNGAAPEQLERALAADAELTRIAQTSARTAGVGQGLTTLCRGLAMWGALLVGVAAVREARLDGVLLAGLALIPLVAFELVTGLPAATQTLQRVRRAAARVQEVIDTPAPVAEPAYPVTLGTPLASQPDGNTHREQSRYGHSRDEPSQDGHSRVEYSKNGDSFDEPSQDSHSPDQPSQNDGSRVVAPSRPLPLHELRVRDLHSSYPGAEEAALRGIDLDLSPGRRVAIVGPSGAGKSTLAGVLLRFLPYQGGSVELDGVEISDLDGDALRRVVGLVSQDAHVFDSTIEQNLRLARRDASARELRDALAAARLLDWVDGLPHGIATEVGERGARMSGGQRQRLAIARALLGDFPLLILDEPGEHLDTQTADAILADLLAGTRDRTTLLITHRLVGLEQVDEVLVLDRGQVVERGMHAELIELDGRYATLWRRERGSGVEAMANDPAQTTVSRHGQRSDPGNSVEAMANDPAQTTVSKHGQRSGTMSRR
jgi:ATP-binding cassette, subfamily C, bacterial CydCD